MKDARSLPNALVAYSVILLEHEASYLLLQRSPSKRIHPNLWTGIGGKVEDHEFADLRRSALRELLEETGISGDAVTSFCLRRVLLHARRDAPLTLLLYFTGSLNEQMLPACSEGTLAWFIHMKSIIWM